MTWQVLEVDCLDAMKGMDEASVDAVVCDPPYGLEFMGKEWDRLQAPGRDDLRHRRRMDTAPDPEQGNPWASERKSYGNVKKNPRCKRCQRLRFDHEPRRCNCEQPDWDLRLAESAQVMQEWHQAWATEALRVLKPGGHLLAFGGTRTYHRLACAVEDAGFEIRDSVTWLYGSGFPKSLDVSKAIDKAAGVEMESRGHFQFTQADTAMTAGAFRTNAERRGESRKQEPATPEAQRWEGWGTALKPAHEPIVVARKPLIGTVAQTVERFGTGALNVDATRIQGTKPHREVVNQQENDWDGGGPWKSSGIGSGESSEGRWPPNVVLSPEAAAELDRQSGERVSGSRKEGEYGRLGYQGWDEGPMPAIEGDRGGASRYFYTAKASRAERNAGLEGRQGAVHRYGAGIGEGHHPEAPSIERNVHPTVKPIALMRWLCRLVTPPGGLILDPFVGSGTTGIAAVLEDFDFIGIEREAEYVEIARARIAWWESHKGREADEILELTRRSENERERHELAGQMGLEI